MSSSIELLFKTFGLNHISNQKKLIILQKKLNEIYKTCALNPSLLLIVYNPLVSFILF